MSDTSLPFLKVYKKQKGYKIGQKRAQSGSSTSERYQYAPLEEHHIRLICISVEPDTGIVICNFHHRDLVSSLGAYIAISYCWGDPAPAYRVNCGNGRSLLLTKSAAEILTHVMIPESNNPETEYFWIDQLCINQEDRAEKSAQVLLMGRIYSSTRQVMAWLGCGNESDKRAVEFVKMLFNEIAKMKQNGSQPTLGPILSSTVTPRTFISNVRIGRKESALINFLKNPWFERVWVMQEVIMACAETTTSPFVEHPILLCFENSTIGFGTLAEVLRTLETDNLLLRLFYDQPSSEGTKGRGVEPPGLTAVRLFSRLREDVNRRQQIRLTTGLNRAWDFKASNDSDKLYAVRGFCSQVGSEEFRLDYEAPVDEVYKTWTATIFESLDFYPWQLHMAGIGLQRSYTCLPSWVPDYSTSSPWVQLRPETSQGTEGAYYRASGPPSKAGFVIDRSSWSLRLRGIPIDTITTVFRQPSGQSDDGLWYRIKDEFLLNPDRRNYAAQVQWLKDIKNFLRTSASVSDDKEVHVEQVLWQTLISNYNPEEATPNSVFWQCYEIWDCANWLLAGNLKSSLMATFAISRQGEVCKQMTTFESLKTKSLGNRPVFGTGQRRLLGNGPVGLQEGDVVCIVKGMCTPFLLREATESREGCEDVGKRWRLVGACFVHGLMYGEAMNMGEMEEFVVV